MEAQYQADDLTEPDRVASVTRSLKDLEAVGIATLQAEAAEGEGGTGRDQES